MKKLPVASIYEKEFSYMPWGKLINKTLSIVAKNTPKNARVLDMMCGPGYLLGKIKRKRPDLDLTGVDINSEFIRFARLNYRKIKFIRADARKWKTKEKFDLILCTGGIHHLPYKDQKPLLISIKSMLSPGGFCIFADPYIDDYSNEKERKKAAEKLGNEYTLAVKRKNAPSEIVKATHDIKFNDIMGTNTRLL